jgi:hypothetical protein
MSVLDVKNIGRDLKRGIVGGDSLTKNSLQRKIFAFFFICTIFIEDARRVCVCFFFVFFCLGFCYMWMITDVKLFGCSNCSNMRKNTTQLALARVNPHPLAQTSTGRPL